jgi:hypothetical protein
MSRIVRLTESDLTRIVRRVIMEQELTDRNAVMQKRFKLEIESSGRQSGSNVVWFTRYGQDVEIQCDGRILTPLASTNVKDEKALVEWVKAYCKYVPA